MNICHKKYVLIFIFMGCCFVLLGFFRESLFTVVRLCEKVKDLLLMVMTEISRITILFDMGFWLFLVGNFMAILGKMVFMLDLKGFVGIFDMGKSVGM